MLPAEMDVSRSLELLHMTVYSQCFSPCGKYLAVGNNLGQIGVFSLSSALGSEAKEQNKEPSAMFQAHSGPIYCLSSTDRHLISAGDNEVKGWLWTDLCKKGCVAAWCRAAPSRNNLETPEINSLVLNHVDNSLLLGGGSCHIHVMDLETGAFTVSFHGVSGGGVMGATLSMISSPGVQVHPAAWYRGVILQISTQKFCLATDSDWMVCGGGPMLSLWHLRSVTPTTIFPIQESQQKVMFYQDLILCAGHSPHINHCQINGEIRAQIPSTPSSIYSLCINETSQENKVLTAAGSSSRIDVFTNFRYRAFSLTFT
ncbi:THO complex subunit 6 [Pyxicephalus adspersus]|uniref:THO complex subunit 6 n=1 Tax=Pyxicephalus adspersus TaxID=30357 RepID=UPI003B5C1196